MTRPVRMDLPHTHLLDSLRGLEFPASVAEVLEHAERHGASPALLDYLESLPAAVFTTAEGLRHAFAGMDQAALGGQGEDEVLVGKDGTSS